MTDETRIWRLGLPDDWEPEGYWCVSFQIPAGDQYVEALAAVLGLLTISKTFDRDETHTGASIVAKTWKRAIMIAPMQVSETCAIIPPIPVPDEEAAADISAALFNQFFRVIVQQINTCAPTQDDCSGCVDDLYASLVPYGASQGVRGALMRLCSDLNQLTPTQRGEYELQCVYDEEFQAITEDVNSNPFDWLNQLAGWMAEWLDDTSDAILNDLATVGNLMGGGGLFGFVQDNGGITPGGGADFGSTCPWDVTFNFLVTDGSWVPYHVTGAACAPPDDQYDAAEYLTGSGWMAVWHSCDGWNNMAIQYNLTNDFMITGVDIHYHTDYAIPTGVPGVYTGSPLIQLASFTPSVGTHVEELGISPQMTQDGVLVIGVALGNTLGSAATAAITKLVVHGTGYNPWM